MMQLILSLILVYLLIAVWKVTNPSAMSASDTAASAASAPGPLSQILQPIRGRLLVAGALAAVGTMLTLVPLALIAHVAQQAWAGSQVALWPNVLLAMLSLLAGMALVMTGELLAHWADNRLTFDLRMAALRRLGQVPLGWFTSRASGEVKQALQDDMGTLHSLTAHFYTSMGRAAGAIAIAVVYLFAVDWCMAVVALLPFPGFFLFLRHAMKRSGDHMQDFVARLGQINSATAELTGGMAVIKAFAGAGRVQAGYHDAVDGFAQAFKAFTRPLIISMARAHALVAPATVLGVVLLGGALFVRMGWMEPIDLLPFLLVAPGICAPVLLLHTLLHDLQGAAGAAQRVLALLDTPVLAPLDPRQHPLPQGHEVHFDGVGYAYEAGQLVLADMNLVLKPGTVTAIVGPSGSGKSTLARLLLRFFDPTEGCITLGGVDLRALESATLYRHIGFVLQEVQLVHASVRDNIALARPGASQQEVEAAARAAQIHECILALPRGYDSVVGEDAQFSGGERQRLSIARAILLDAPVLVLDEATAAADAENEAAVEDALARFARGRTVLVIAHRLDTVVHADQIVVMKGGSMVEQGRHAQLLAQAGPYAKLWQLGGYGTATQTQEAA